MKKILAFFLCILCFSYSFAQKGFFVDLSTGVEQAKWITHYQRHLLPPLYREGQLIAPAMYWGLPSIGSVKKTHLPIAVKIGYQVNRWRFGLAVQYSRSLIDSIGRGSDGTLSASYKISNKGFDIVRFGISSAFSFLRIKKYAVATEIEVGVFEENSQHIDKQDFGFKSYFKLGLPNTINFKQFSIFATPHFTRLSIHPKLKEREDMQRIDVFGVELGCRLFLRK